jgi:hypothetical protein
MVVVVVVVPVLVGRRVKSVVGGTASACGTGEAPVPHACSRRQRRQRRASRKGTDRGRGLGISLGSGEEEEEEEEEEEAGDLPGRARPEALASMAKGGGLTLLQWQSAAS